MQLGTFSSGGLGFGLAFTLVDSFSAASRNIQRQMTSLTTASSAMAASVNASMARMRLGTAGLMFSLVGLAGWAKAARVDAEFQNYELALRSFVSSAAEAHRIFENVKQDAIANPKFSIAGMEKANLMLISQGVNAERSRQTVKDLTQVLLGVGAGEAELSRVSIALDKIKATGFLTGQSIRSFYTARIPILDMLKESLGRTIDPSKIAKERITFDQLADAIHKTTTEGGRFGKVMEMLKGNVSATGAQLRENFIATLADIGHAIRPVTIALLTFLGKVVSHIQKFVSTPFGANVMRALLAVNLFLFGISLLTVVMAGSRLMLLRMAGAFGVQTRSSILAALTANRTGLAFGIMGKAVLRAMWPAIRTAALLYILKEAFESNIPVVNTFGFVLALAMGPLGWIAGLIMVVSRALKEFNAVMDGSAKPTNGVIGWYQKLGGIIQFTIEAIKGFNSDTNKVEVPKQLLQVMDYLGMGNTARNISTWVIAFSNFWAGFKKGAKEAWNTVKELLEKVHSFFAIFDNGIDRSKTGLDVWKERGRTAGKLLIVVLGALVAALLAYIVVQTMAMLQTIALFVAMGLSFIFANAAIIGIIIVIGVLIYALGKLFNWWGDVSDGANGALYTMGDKAGSVLTGLIPTFGAAGKSMGESLGAALTTSVDSTLNKLKSKIDGWFDSHLWFQTYGTIENAGPQKMGANAVANAFATPDKSTAPSVYSSYRAKVDNMVNSSPVPGSSRLIEDMLYNQYNLKADRNKPDSKQPIKMQVTIPITLNGTEIAREVMELTATAAATMYSDASTHKTETGYNGF